MGKQVFLHEVYRYYFEHGGNNYLFVVLEDRRDLIGRLYNDHGMVPDFHLNIDDKVRQALSSYFPGNPFKTYIKAAKDYVNEFVN
jgi:hypothetical protein